MVKKANPRVNLKELEEEVQKKWSDNSIFEKSVERVKDKEKYYFLDGPPYASGAVHLGTAWNKVLKDAIVRFQVMNGKNVRRQAHVSSYAGQRSHGTPGDIDISGDGWERAETREDS